LWTRPVSSQVWWLAAPPPDAVTYSNSATTRARLTSSRARAASCVAPFMRRGLSRGEPGRARTAAVAARSLPGWCAARARTTLCASRSGQGATAGQEKRLEDPGSLLFLASLSQPVAIQIVDELPGVPVTHPHRPCRGVRGCAAVSRWLAGAGCNREGACCLRGAG